MKLEWDPAEIPTAEMNQSYISDHLDDSVSSSPVLLESTNSNSLSYKK